MAYPGMSEKLLQTKVAQVMGQENRALENEEGASIRTGSWKITIKWYNFLWLNPTTVICANCLKQEDDDLEM